MLISSFKSDAEILGDPWGLPGALRFENWARAWTEAHIGRYFLNSAIVVSGSLTLTMLFGATAAYVFARYEFRGRQLALLPVCRRDDVPGLPRPGAALLRGPKRRAASAPGPGLILVYAAYSLPFTVFFLTAFFRTLPTSVAEAALVDGCGHFRLFFRVMLPMARPGLVSVAIFNFLSHWNQFILPQVLMQGDESKWVLAQGLAALAVSQGYAGRLQRPLRRADHRDAAGAGRLRRLPTPGSVRPDRRPAQVRHPSSFPVDQGVVVVDSITKSPRYLLDRRERLDRRGAGRGAGQQPGDRLLSRAGDGAGRRGRGPRAARGRPARPPRPRRHRR